MANFNQCKQKIKGSQQNADVINNNGAVNNGKVGGSTQNQTDSRNQRTNNQSQENNSVQ
jgi:hypothetical protein